MIDHCYVTSTPATPTNISRSHTTISRSPDPVGKIITTMVEKIVGSEAVSGVLCLLCKNQPHPLDHLQCKGQSVVLSQHTKSLMTSGEH